MGRCARACMFADRRASVRLLPTSTTSTHAHTGSQALPPSMLTCQGNGAHIQEEDSRGHTSGRKLFKRHISKGQERMCDHSFPK